MLQHGNKACVINGLLCLFYMLGNWTASRYVDFPIDIYLHSNLESGDSSNGGFAITLAPFERKMQLKHFNSLWKSDRNMSYALRALIGTLN
tara:strand:+ start:364 stop:636 length:273 start_codon:yes stop_codon:yes gene_type:complete